MINIKDYCGDIGQLLILLFIGGLLFIVGIKILCNIIKTVIGIAAVGFVIACVIVGVTIFMNKTDTTATNTNDYAEEIVDESYDEEVSEDEATYEEDTIIDSDYTSEPEFSEESNIEE